MSVENWATTREIRQQPAIWAAWSDEFGADLPDLRDWMASLAADEIWLCGAGTSAYIGDLIAAHLGADPRRIRAVSTTDFVSVPQNFVRPGLRPLVVSFGRSGNSAETIGTLDILDHLMPEAPRLNITCNGESALATRRPVSGDQRTIILPDACHDAGFAMTSSFTTMLLTALWVLDDAITAEDLRGLSETAALMMDGLFQMSADMVQPDRVVFTGSGALTFAAREAALKVMELAAGDIPAIWDSNLGFRHGPKSFVTPKTRIFQFLSGDAYTRKYDDDLTAELKTQFGPEFVITIGAGDADIAFPALKNDALAGVLCVLVAQILAVTWSDKMGLNVDNPFQGKGTLTRVVSGVKLYLPEVL
ncbi:MAG TPA: phosphosugar isomerase [Aliiroseovarius sp.]|nr:phosphosugar isomerase [Aliiroseovarius sp.]